MPNAHLIIQIHSRVELLIKKLPLNLWTIPLKFVDNSPQIVKIFKNIWMALPNFSHNSHVIFLNLIKFIFVITLALSFLKLKILIPPLNALLNYKQDLFYSQFANLMSKPNIMFPFPLTS